MLKVSNTYKVVFTSDLAQTYPLDPNTKKHFTLLKIGSLRYINLVMTFASFVAMPYANFHHLFLDFCGESSSILRQKHDGFFCWTASVS